MKSNFNSIIRAAALAAALCISAASGFAQHRNIRLVYWNIQNGMWDGQNDNYNRFVNWVNAQNPDICVWCEAQSNYKTDSDKPLAPSDRYLDKNWSELAGRYGHNYIYTGAHPDGFPQVITSKYPITGIERISGSKKDTLVMHGAGWATLDVAGRHLNIVTLHLAPHQWRPWTRTEAERKASAERHEGDKWRRCEIQYICEHTILSPGAAENGDLWMMMGDFNSRSRVDNNIYGHEENSTKFYVHDYIAASTPYRDIMTVKHPGNFEATVHYPCRLDYVYMTPSLGDFVTRAFVCRDAYTDPVRDPQKLSNFWRPSDHLPIIVDFDFSVPEVK